MQQFSQIEHNYFDDSSIKYTNKRWHERYKSLPAIQCWHQGKLKKMSAQWWHKCASIRLTFWPRTQSWGAIKPISVFLRFSVVELRASLRIMQADRQTARRTDGRKRSVMRPISTATQFMCIYQFSPLDHFPGYFRSNQNTDHS